MKYDRVIAQALRDVQDTLSANFPPEGDVPDDRAVACLRAIVGAPEVQRAMERGNDTALNLVLRAVNHVLSESAQPSCTAINRLWDFMDQPELNQALGLPRDPGMNLWLKKPPAR
jgi:hypothetical protein